MSADVRDILDLEQPSGEITKDAVLNNKRKVNYDRYSAPAEKL